MIVVDKYDVKLKGAQGIVTTELALLLHIMRTEHPQILYEAMEAEDKLFIMTKKGK